MGTNPSTRQPVKRFNRLQLSATIALGAFVGSFFLPAYGKAGYDPQVGWHCAVDMVYVAFHNPDLLGFVVGSLSTAGNLLVPLILAMLAASRFAHLLPRFTPWLVALFALNAGYWFWVVVVLGHPLFMGSDALLAGYYVWWSCQMAAAALAFLNRGTEPGLNVQSPTAHLV